MQAVDVTLATRQERAALENMMQLYIHDFSEFWAGRSDGGELGDDGRFGPYPLDPYWRDAGHVPLLIRTGGHLVGFALLNSASHTGGTVDRNMAEFFVARKHRRGGVGTAAAHAIFSRYPGRWETAVARYNTGARPFWRGAAQRHPKASEIEEIDVNDKTWNGPVIRFRIAP